MYRLFFTTTLLLHLFNQFAAASPGVTIIDADDRHVFSPNGAFLFQADSKCPHEIHVWDLSKRENVRTLKFPGNETTKCLSLSADGKRMAAGSEKGRVAIWNLEKQSEPQVLSNSNNKSAIESVTLSPRGNLVAASFPETNTVCVWNIQSGKSPATVRSENQDFKYCAFNSDENSALVLFENEAWRCDTAQPDNSSRVADNITVQEVTASRDGKTLAVSMSDKLELWSISPFQRGKALPYTPPVGAYFLKSSENLLLVRMSGGPLSVDSWKIGPDVSQSSLYRKDDQCGHVLAGAVADGGAQVAYSTQNGKGINLASPDLNSSHLLKDSFGLLYENFPVISALAYSPDGKYLVSSRSDKELRVWDAEAGRTVWQGQSTLPAATVRFSGDASTLVLVAPLGGIELRGFASTLKDVPTVKTFNAASELRHGLEPGQIDISPDDTRLAFIDRSGVVLVNTDTMKSLRSISLNAARIGFTRDSSKLMILTETERYLYYLGTGQLEKIAEGQLGGIGVETISVDRRLKLQRVLPGGSAIQSAKIKAGDEIIAVAERENDDFQAVSDQQYYDARKLLLGPIGTSVRLKIAGENGTTNELTLVRRPLNGSGSVPVGPPALDGRYVSGAVNQRHALWDTDTGCVTCLMRPRILRLAGQQALSRDGHFYATLSNKKDVNGIGIEIFDVATGSVAMSGPLDIRSYHDISFSPDGAEILVATDHTVEFFDKQLGKLVRTLDVAKPLPQKEEPTGFDPAGQAAADILSTDASAPGYDLDIETMAVSPQGIIAIGTSRGVVQLYDMKTLARLHSLPHANSAVSNMQISDSGKLLGYVVDKNLYVMDISKFNGSSTSAR